MVKVLLDTNIVIDVLNGVPEAQEVLNSYPERAISIITYPLYKNLLIRCKGREITAAALLTAAVVLAQALR